MYDSHSVICSKLTILQENTRMAQCGFIVYAVGWGGVQDKKKVFVQGQRAQTSFQVRRSFQALGWPMSTERPLFPITADSN